MDVNGKFLLQTKIILRKRLQPFPGHNSSENEPHMLYEEQTTHLHDLMTRTLISGESNSALLIGARGSGKSSIIDSLLCKLEDRKLLTDGIVVKLCGLLQTDDRLAIKEITRQLRLESETEGKTFNSFAENLAYLLDSLKSGSKEKSKPVLFVLDEFDLFCHHKNQTLLYNLFDIAQSAQAPICVIGLTCRLDIIELLEKRVKSRFSHRQIFIFPPNVFDPEYLSIIEKLLTLEGVTLNDKYTKEWNQSVNKVLKDKTVYNILKRLLDINNDIRNLKTFLIIVLNYLNMSTPFLTSEMFCNASKLVFVNSKIAMLHSLSILHICLLIAMKHLTEIYEGEPFNFEMIYKEYMKFCNRRSTAQNFERSVVFKAYDQLQSLEVVRRIDNVKGMQREHQLVQLMVPSIEITEALSSAPNIPTDVVHWAGSSYA